MKEASAIIARILGSSAQKSRPQGRGLLVRADVVLHPSVGNQPDRRDQDVRRDADPYPQQRADYAEEVNQRADPALEVAAARLPQPPVRSLDARRTLPWGGGPTPSRSRLSGPSTRVTLCWSRR